ncbi:MAG: PIN domain-containing protein [Phormidesmis sp.]
MTRPPLRLLTRNSSQPKYRALLDADILSECLYNRGAFIQDIETLLLTLREVSHVELYVTDRALKHIAAKNDDFELILDTIEYLRSRFSNERILPVSNSLIEQARHLDFPDFESAIEHTCATKHGFDALITQNPSNFPGAAIAIWTISSLSKRLTLEDSLNQVSQIDSENHTSFIEEISHNQREKILISITEEIKEILQALACMNEISISDTVCLSLKNQHYLESVIRTGGQVVVETNEGIAYEFLPSNPDEE